MDTFDSLNVLFGLFALFVSPIVAIVLLLQGDTVGAAVFGSIFGVALLALVAIGSVYP